jgi:hypothetical protein
MLIMLLVTWRDDDAVERQAKTLLHPRGWFVAETYTPDEDEDDGTTLFRIEPFVGQRTTEIPDKLYHATPAQNVPRILKQGLIPQRGKHTGMFAATPNRIYIAKSLAYAVDIKNMLQKHDGYRQDYAIIEIDTTKLRKGTKFYIDPQYHSGVYTTTPVPPAALRVLGNEEVEQCPEPDFDYELAMNV